MVLALALAAAWSVDAPQAPPSTGHYGREAAAGTWPRERGLPLADLPSYDPAQETVADFARQLETFCGLERGAALQAEEGGDLVIQPEELPNAEALFCLTYGFLASNGSDHGLQIGFISESLPNADASD
jgi:hypothetical protein